MKNIVDFELFEDDKTPQAPGAGAAGAEVAPAVFGKIEFGMSGVKNDAMQVIAGLMAQSLINADQQEASRIIQKVKEDPGSAASYIEQRVKGILSSVPGISPDFIDKLYTQRTNLAKAMVTAIPGLVGGYVNQISSQKVDLSKMLKPDLSRTSFFNKLGGYFQED